MKIFFTLLLFSVFLSTSSQADDVVDWSKSDDEHGASKELPEASKKQRKGKYKEGQKERETASKELKTDSKENEQKLEDKKPYRDQKFHQRIHLYRDRH